MAPPWNALRRRLRLQYHAANIQILGPANTDLRQLRLRGHGAISVVDERSESTFFRS